MVSREIDGCLALLRGNPESKVWALNQEIWQERQKSSCKETLNDDYVCTVDAPCDETIDEGAILHDASTLISGRVWAQRVLRGPASGSLLSTARCLTGQPR
ncbi:hypothetical protein PV11_06099 [Exophiala sideris]|uniref:Uncharacterized protein n=1 Tax=Exophiala sideris TaxID=1016849 RepID=A0A0D1X8J6_9EURO|nr:hypothetical protein PV11_06099 [Exophiala sideris]